MTKLPTRNKGNHDPGFFAMNEHNKASANPQSASAADEWLLVIDMQHAFGADDSVWKVEGFWEIAPRVQRLMAAYENRTIMMRYVSPVTSENGWLQYLSHYPSMRLPADDHAWDIVINHPPGIRIETRATFAKWDAEIAAVVGPDARVALCGVATECCVLATAMAAIDEGCLVSIVEDACAGATVQLHQRAIEMLSTLTPLVRITRVAEITRL